MGTAVAWMLWATVAMSQDAVGSMLVSLSWHARYAVIFWYTSCRSALTAPLTMRLTFSDGSASRS